MSDKVSYQEGIIITRVFTDPRFPHIMITNCGGGTFHVYHWSGGMGDLPQEPDHDDGEFPFYGWQEADVFTVYEEDKDHQVDEAFAHMMAAKHFDDMERFPCESCTGECRPAADLDRHPKGNMEIGIYCPGCSRELGTQWRRVKR